MGASNRRIRVVCTECKYKQVASPGDEWRYACDRCGGQLKVIRYGPAKRKTR